MLFLTESMNVKKEAGMRVDEAFKRAGAAHMPVRMPALAKCLLVGKQIYGIHVIGLARRTSQPFHLETRMYRIPLVKHR